MNNPDRSTQPDADAARRAAKLHERHVVGSPRDAKHAGEEDDIRLGPVQGTPPSEWKLSDEELAELADPIEEEDEPGRPLQFSMAGMLVFTALVAVGMAGAVWFPMPVFVVYSGVVALCSLAVFAYMKRKADWTDLAAVGCFALYMMLGLLLGWLRK